MEDDAKARLGVVAESASYPIERVIAVRHTLRQEQAGLPARVAAADFGYCVISGAPSAPVRWPAGGWLTGGIDDIALCIEHSMVSKRLIDERISIPERGVRIATRVVEDAKLLGCRVIEQHLGQVLKGGGEQTTRIAMTMIANALTFHGSIVSPHDIPCVNQIEAQACQLRADCPLGQMEEDSRWGQLLADLQDRFGSARTGLGHTANRILDPLVRAADQLADLVVTTRHDLSDRMFRNLIVERKFVGTLYTLPTSSTVLAKLVTRRLDTDWGELLGCKRLLIADLSCGAGTLLSAAYNTVLTRYRQASGDDGEIHRHMVEHSIIGTDIATPDGQRSRRSPSETVRPRRSS